MFCEFQQSIEYDENAIYKLACLYMGLTEIWDRRLTDLRSPYDNTEAFVPAHLKSLSNSSALQLRNKIIKEYCIHWNEIKKQIHKHINYSAQMWVDEYKRLWRSE